MSDENSIGLQTDPNDISNIEKLIASVNKLDNSLQHLATAGQGLNDLKQMMVQMQATMVTGFTEMAASHAQITLSYCALAPLTTACPTSNQRCDEPKPKGTGLCAAGSDASECATGT